MSELKPCANCAGEATRQAPNMHRKTCIACKECGMSTGWGTVEEVTATWNRRVQPDDLLTSTRRAQHMPTVDAVEVVRCRDCVHFGECLVTENDYCSKGERKENE